MRLSLISIGALYLALTVVPLVAQTIPADALPVWKILGQAEFLFDSGDFSGALIQCEKAKETHRESVAKDREILARSFASPAAKKAGDSLPDVYQAMKERSDSAGLTVLDRIFEKRTMESFGKSLASLKSWLSLRAAFPEADYLTGLIFETEGEYALAMDWYLRAYADRAFFDIPDQKYELLYRMASLSRIRGENGRAETYLLDILKDDSVYGNVDTVAGAGNIPVLSSMTGTLSKKNGASQLFLLYRIPNFTAYQAALELSELYLRTDSNFDKALETSSVAAVMAVTKIENAVRQQDHEFAYTGISALFSSLKKYDTINEMAKNNKLWDSFMLLADALVAKGFRLEASYILQILSTACPDTQTSSRAKTFLADL